VKIWGSETRFLNILPQKKSTPKHAKTAKKVKKSEKNVKKVKKSEKK